MAIQTKYSYLKQINMAKLITEIASASLSIALQHVDSTDLLNGTWATDIWFVDVLSDTDVTTLNTVVINHTTAPISSDYVRNKIVAARNFGQYLLDEVATDNVLLNITTDQVASLIIKYSSIMAMLQSGSLYTALGAMQIIEPDDIMTQARKDKYINEIKVYLGIA